MCDLDDFKCKVTAGKKQNETRSANRTDGGVGCEASEHGAGPERQRHESENEEARE